jgi:hypothetical protein
MLSFFLGDRMNQTHKAVTQVLTVPMLLNFCTQIEGTCVSTSLVATSVSNPVFTVVSRLVPAKRFLPKGSYRNVPAKKVPAKKALETQRFLPKRFLPKRFLPKRFLEI